MKAVVVVAPDKVEVRELPVPKFGQDEALVRIEACGICGTTDRHIVEGCQAHHPSNWYPAVLGHEAVGIVVEVGPRVKKFKVGDRVTRPVSIWPGTNQDGLYSAWGGFAEYGIVRDRPAEQDYTSDRQHIVPKNLSLQDAVMAISISEVASWMGKLGDLREKSVVIGGTGFAAAVMCQCARAAGAKIILAVGRNPKKFKWMLTNGASHTLSLSSKTADEIRQLNEGSGGDWFLDGAGHQTVFEAGLGFLRSGGQAAIYGAPAGFAYRVPLGAVGGDFSVHYFSPHDDKFFAETCHLIASGKINARTIHTHTWHGLGFVPQALQEQMAGDVLKGMILLATAHN